MNKKNSNVVVAYNLAGKFVLNGINFFVVSVFIRLLGTENFGLFSLYLTWQSIMMILVGLQTQSIIGNVSIRYSNEERYKFFSSNVCFCAIISLFFLLSILSFGDEIAVLIGLPVSILYFMLLQSYTGYAGNVVLGIWSFDLEAKRNFWVSILLSLINIGLSLLLIISIQEYDQKYIGRIIGSGAPIILFGIASIFFLLRKGKTLYNKEFLKYTLGFSIPIVFHALSNLILSQSDRVMLQKMGTLREVGVYSVIFTLNNLLNILMEAFNGAWVPYFYSDLKEKRIDDIKRKSYNFIWLFAMITIGFLLVSPEVLLLYGGEEFRDSIKAIPFLSIGSFFVFLYSFPINYKYYKGKTKSIAVGTISAGGINVLLNLWLIPLFGIYGASIATLLSYIILWFFHHVGAKRLDKEEYPYSMGDFLKPILLISLVAVLSFTVFYGLYILRWLSAVAVGVCLVGSIIKRKNIW